MRRPDLDDVFLALTGHAAEEDEPDDAGGDRSSTARVPATTAGSTR
jgi:ABC-2 type transport system ATP-binding protein